MALLRDDGEAFSGGGRAPASTEIIDVTPPHVGLGRAIDKNTFGVDGEASSGADPASFAWLVSSHAWRPRRSPSS